MRFLCLHGAGTNSQVLETQTASIRYELDDDNTYEYVEGVLPATIAPEIKSYYSPSEEYFVYFEPSAASIQTALSQLVTYVSLEGPFDGVLAYSQGATLAAMFLIAHAKQHPLSPLPFRCAIFISGGIPADPTALLEKDEIRFLDPERDGQLLKLPTTHVWGRNDNLWPGTSQILCGLCEDAGRFVFVHDGGHDIPSARSKDAVQGVVRAIRRTVDMALNTQQTQKI